MTHLANLNRFALQHYLDGEAGGELRRIAQQELWERGQKSATMTEEEMADYLESQGYGILSPDDLDIQRTCQTCPWCGAETN